MINERNYFNEHGYVIFKQLINEDEISLVLKNFDFFIKGYKNYLLNTSKNKICIFENFIQEPEKSLRNMCSILKIDYDKNYLKKIKDVNLTGDPNAKNSINIHAEDSLSKKKLIKDGDLNKIKNRADFISLMKDLKGYY